MKMFHNHIWFIYAIYEHIWPYMQIYMWHIWHIWENICLNIYATYMSTYKMSYMFRIFFHIWNIYACSVWARKTLSPRLTGSCQEIFLTKRHRPRPNGFLCSSVPNGGRYFTDSRRVPNTQVVGDIIRTLRFSYKLMGLYYRQLSVIWEMQLGKTPHVGD